LGGVKRENIKSAAAEVVETLSGLPVPWKDKLRESPQCVVRGIHVKVGEERDNLYSRYKHKLLGKKHNPRPIGSSESPRPLRFPLGGGNIQSRGIFQQLRAHKQRA